LIHVVETVGAMIYGENIDDHETSVDEKLLEEYKVILSEKGFKVAIQLGLVPNKVIPEIINEGNFDVWLWELMVIQDSKIYFLELPLTNCDTRFLYHCL
jgi:hypothetical protein